MKSNFQHFRIYFIHFINTLRKRKLVILISILLISIVVLFFHQLGFFERKCVFATIAYNKDGLAAAYVLSENLKEVNSKHDLIVLTSNTSIFNQLNNIGIKSLYRLSHYKEYFTVKTSKFVRKRSRMLKLEFWNFPQYHVIVFLDSDILIKENIDELCTFPEMSAVLDPGTMDKYNTGVMIIKPNRIKYRQLRNQPFISYNYGDQGFLNHYLKDKFQMMSTKYNALWRLHKYYNWESIYKDIKIIHMSSNAKLWNFYKIGNNDNYNNDNDFHLGTALKWAKSVKNLKYYNQFGLVPTWDYECNQYLNNEWKQGKTGSLPYTKDKMTIALNLCKRINNTMQLIEMYNMTIIDKIILINNCNNNLHIYEDLFPEKVKIITPTHDSLVHRFPLR